MRGWSTPILVIGLWSASIPAPIPRFREGVLLVPVRSVTPATAGVTIGWVLVGDAARPETGWRGPQHPTAESQEETL